MWKVRKGAGKALDITALSVVSGMCLLQQIASHEH